MWFHDTLFHVGICALLLHLCSSDCHQLSLVLHYWLEVILSILAGDFGNNDISKVNMMGLVLIRGFSTNLDIPAVAGMSGSVLKHLIHAHIFIQWKHLCGYRTPHHPLDRYYLITLTGQYSLTNRQVIWIDDSMHTL